MRSNIDRISTLAVSAANKEAALNQAMTLDSALPVKMGDILQLSQRIEDNSNERGGAEEVTRLDNLGGTLSASIGAEKLTPHVAAFILAYFYGEVSTSALGGGTYRHTITPIDGDLEDDRSDPTFTCGQQLAEVEKELFLGCMVNDFTLSAAEDGWAQATAAIIGTGSRETNLIEEEVAGNSDDTDVTLAANAVQGASAADRLDSVHRIEWKKTGNAYWEEVDYSAASDATPAAITITAPDALNTDAGIYRVLYVPIESSSLGTDTLDADPPNDNTGVISITTGGLTPDEHIGRWVEMTSGTADGRIFKITDNAADSITCDGCNLYAAGVRSADTIKVVQFGWAVMPAYPSEDALRISQLDAIVGGEWDGTDFNGGRTISAQIKNFEVSGQKGATAKLTPGSGQSKVANRILREGRSQTITISKELRNAIYSHMANLDSVREFGLRVVLEGGLIDGSNRFTIEGIFPRCGLTGSERGLDGKRLNESLKVTVMEDTAYGSAIWRVTNQQATYAA